jgi:hypothetical protein
MPTQSHSTRTFTASTQGHIQKAFELRFLLLLLLREKKGIELVCPPRALLLRSTQIKHEN